MSLPLQATAIAADPGLNAWFVGLGDDFLGRVAENALRSGMVEGWSIGWRGRELEVQIDADFPFSAACIYLKGYTRERAQPHVEKNGKLCIGAKPSGGDAVRSVATALAEAFQLLAENETRQHDDDFREDFSLYWLNWAREGAPIVRIQPGDGGALKSTLAHTIVTDRGAFVLPSKIFANRFFTNLAGKAPRRLRRTAVISIDPLPAPDRYPATAAELWALVEGRSEAGADLLARLLANDPREAYVVLAGTAPSGREHYAAIRILRPVDASGRVQKKRTMRAGIERAPDPNRALFARFRIERLATSRLDAAATRMPAGTHQQMAAAKVVIAGCGALGSGVARLLAQAGIEHLDLVDPEKLGWENIRRHELGARCVGQGKAEALADAIRADIPTIRFIGHHATTFATFAREHPDAIAQADLIVSCTGEWVADASVEHVLKRFGLRGAAIYCWMETHALAAHAVLLGRGINTLSEGFDEVGNFRLPAVAGGRPAPPECGGASTPFGAIELSNAQAFVARLVVDAVRGLATAPTWRTWLTDATALREAEATWAAEWLSRRGHPGDQGGIVSGEWTFP